MKQKKIYTSEEKTIILRQHLENQVPISELADKYALHPNVIYSWKKQLFEQAPQSLARKTKKGDDTKQKIQEQRIAELEALLARRDNLISELASENIDLKKKPNGAVFVRNGSNRK